MTNTLTTGALHQQHFTTPGHAIRAQTHAIQRDADHRTRRVAFHVTLCAVLCQHRRDMGMVVLHGNGADP